MVVPRAYKTGDGPINKTLASLLRTHPYLSYGPSGPGRNFFAHFKLEETKVTARTIPHWPTILKMCSEGTGWSLIPGLYVVDLPNNLHAIPVSESILPSSEFHLFYPRDLIKLSWFRDLVGECLQF